MRGAADGSWWVVVAYALYAVVSAALLAINMPPYQNADETNHFLRADSIARGHLLGQRIANGTDFGGLAAPEIARSGAAFDWPKFHPERKVTTGAYTAAAGHFGEPEAEITFPNTAIYPPPLYLPAVVAVGIGKMTRASILQTLYLARLLTALLSGAAVLAALVWCIRQNAEGAALGIFAVATVPMALSLQSAVSQDGPMLGLAALAAACVVRLRRGSSSAALAGLGCCIGLLAMGRPPYAVLALLPLAARGRWVPRLLTVAGAIVACLLWSAVVTRTGPVAAAANGADMGAQANILLHPERMAVLLFNTLRQVGPEYLEQMVGRLGWLDVVLPGWFIRATLLGLAGCCVLFARPFNRAGLIVTAAVVGAAVAVMLLIYLSWTAVGRPVIDGVQGRYFLPLAVVLGALGAGLPRWMPATAIRIVVLVWPALSIGVTVRALVLRYYLAQ